MTSISANPIGTNTIDSSISNLIIEDIRIKGNETIEKDVILREVLLKKGDKLDRQKLERSKEKIYNLGLFKEVDIEYIPGNSAKTIILVIYVTRNLTLYIAPTFVWSSGVGRCYTITPYINNLFGKGIGLYGDMKDQSYRQMYVIGLYVPYIFDSPFSILFSGIYKNKEKILTPAINFTNSIYYDKAEKGFNGRLDFKLTANSYISAIYEYLQSEYYNFRPKAKADTSSIIPANSRLQEIQRTGKKPTSYQLLLKYDYDKRNNIFFPEHGFHFFQLLGYNSSDMYTFKSDFSCYNNIIWKTVWAFHFNLLYYYNYYNQFDDKDILVNFENGLRIPIRKRIIWVFINLQLYDILNIFNDDYSKDTGIAFGLRVNSPLLPLKISYTQSRDDTIIFIGIESRIPYVEEFRQGFN